MPEQELQHLVTMINQIAANIASTEGEARQVELTADHVKRFWAKSMRDKIIVCADDEIYDLGVVARKAIFLL